MVIEIKKIRGAIDEIKNYRRELLKDKERISKIKYQISNLPNKEGLILQINKIEKEIEQERYNLLVLSQALKEIVSTYEKEERSIINYYEQVQKRETIKLQMLSLDGKVYERFHVRLCR